MLHWLQPNTPRRISFFIELIIVSVLFHTVAFCMLFFHYVGSDSGYHISLGTTYVDLADIVVVPFTPSAVQPVQPQPRPAAPKVPIKKVLPKKRAPTTSIKKLPENKKVVPKKQPEPQKKKVAQPVKKVEQKTPPIMSQKEYDTLALQQSLQEELETHWQPPTGLAKDLSCEVKVSLDRQGSIKQLDFIVPSGVLIYDIHAQSTLIALQYPKQTWGKQLTVTFKQT